MYTNCQHVWRLNMSFTECINEAENRIHRMCNDAYRKIEWPKSPFLETG